jgi:hypothetical protein
MADKLSVTIALEGGAEIQKQLADIGKAGQQAFLDISKSAEQVGGFKNLKPEQVTAKLKEMGIVGVDALNKIQNAVESARRIESLIGAVKNIENGFASLNSTVASVSSALGRLSTLGSAFAAVPLAKPILDFVGSLNKAAQAINEVDSAAIRLGTTISKFDQLRLGFEKMGLSAQAVGSGIATLKNNLDALNVERVRQAFEALQSSTGGGLGSEAMKSLQAAAQGVGKAADDARLALAKLADQQRLKSLQGDLQSTEDTAQRARDALAKLSQVPAGTPGLSQQLSRLRADLENAEIAAARAKKAVDEFKPDPAPLTGAAAALDKLGIAAGDVSQRLPEVVAALAKLPDTASRSDTAIQLFGEAAGTQLIQALRTGGGAIDAFVAKQTGLTQAQADSAAKIEQSFNRSAAAFERFKQTGDVSQLGTVFSEMANRVSISLGKMGEELNTAKTKIGELVSSVSGDTWSAFSSDAVASWNAITAAVNSATEAVKKFQGLKGPKTSGIPPPDTGGGVEMAEGGVVGGRGTGTSDSNLAWVSRGEHIMPARAVSQPGVLSLLETLRSSGGNLRGIGRFATGGVVAMPALAGASGGVGHLGTVDLRTDHGSVTMMASPSAVTQLGRLAVTKRMTSTGRKPGFVG